MKTIATDYENNSEDFWNEIHRLSATNALAKLLVDTDSFYATDAEAEEIEKWLGEIDGWNDPKAAEFAPHPVMISDTDSDVLEALFNREVTGTEGEHDCTLYVKTLTDDEIMVLVDDPADGGSIDSYDRELESAILVDLGRLTKRTLQANTLGWHPTGDSEQSYACFRFEPIVFTGEEAQHAS